VSERDQIVARLAAGLSSSIVIVCKLGVSMVGRAGRRDAASWSRSGVGRGRSEESTRRTPSAERCVQYSTSALLHDQLSDWKTMSE